MFRRLGQPHETVYFIADVAEAASLAAVAVHRQVLPTKRLLHEVRDDAPVVELHARPVGIEDPRNARVNFVVAMVGHGHRFAESLSLIVNRTRTDGIHVAPVGFFLRMLQRIAVALRSGRSQVFRPVLASHIQSVKSAQRTDLESFNSVFRVIYRACRAGEMKYVIHLAAIEWLVDDGLLKIESRVVTEGIKIGPPSRQQIIDGNDRITFRQQCVTKVGTQEPGSAGDQSTRFAHEWLAFLGGGPAASGRASGVPAGRPTL